MIVNLNKRLFVTMLGIFIAGIMINAPGDFWRYRYPDLQPDSVLAIWYNAIWSAGIVGALLIASIFIVKTMSEKWQRRVVFFGTGMLLMVLVELLSGIHSIKPAIFVALSMAASAFVYNLVLRPSVEPDGPTGEPVIELDAEIVEPASNVILLPVRTPPSRFNGDRVASDDVLELGTFRPRRFDGPRHFDETA